MRKVYIVKGSHDGVIGVCSNMKKAYECALKYEPELFRNVIVNGEYKVVPFTYKFLCESNGFARLLNRSSYTQVEIVMMYLNKF